MHAIEPAMDCLLRATVLGGEIASFEDAVAACLAHRLGCRTACGTALLFEKLRGDVASVADAVRADADAVLDRDPACQTSLEVLLYFKGFAALQAHRVAEVCWHRGERGFALWLQSRASEVCGVDIHPAARIGQGVMLDHGTGVVVGETARVGDGCTLMHGVTLGATGKESGDRHPKVGKDVMLGAGVSVLGNIRIGDGAKIGCGSVVLRPVPSGATAVGAPARIIGKAKAASLDLSLNADFVPNAACAVDGADAASAWCDIVAVARAKTRKTTDLIDFGVFYDALLSEGLNAAEIGEVFFALDSDQDGLVSTADFQELFVATAKRFCAGCECPVRTAGLLRAVCALDTGGIAVCLVDANGNPAQQASPKKAHVHW
ncbi:trimeric LpxA-like protein [Pelagophyceae sp. CCMP2097]|nr:trimeric LpxA-like protein [Pelagophyceae sp. CCMP2097]